MSHPPLFERHNVAPDNTPTRRARHPTRLYNPAISDARHEIQSLGRIDDEILTLADIPRRHSDSLSPTSTDTLNWDNWCSCCRRFTFVTCICSVVYIATVTALAVMNLDRKLSVELVFGGLSGAACILLTLSMDRGTYARAYLPVREPAPLCPIPIGVVRPDGDTRTEWICEPVAEAGVAKPQDPNFLTVPQRKSSRLAGRREQEASK